MASILQVEQIKGPTSGASANKITIPSGQTLDASNATLTGLLAPDGDGSSLTGIPAGTEIFCARLSVQQTVSINTQTKMLFSNEVYDTDNNYDATNSKFVAPVDGYYHIGSQIMWQNKSDTGSWQIQIRVNGTNSSPFNANTGYYTQTGVSSSKINAVIQLSANDYVEIYSYQNISTFDAYTESMVYGYRIA